MHRLLFASLLCLCASSVARAQGSPPPEEDPLLPNEGGSSSTAGSAEQPAPSSSPPPASTAPPPPAPAPPPPVEPPPPEPEPAPVTPPPPTTRDDDDEDDGRKADLIWLEAGLGYSYANLVSFNANNFLPSADLLKGSGFTAHVAAGFRIFFLTLGARGWLAMYSGFDLWALVADIALRLPIPVVEPYVRFGIGYGFVGQADVGSPRDSDVSVYGLVIEGGLGLDIYLSPIISIGAGLDLAFLNLTRQRVDACGGAMPPMDCNLMSINFEETGDAAGLSLRAHGQVALHF